jgi:hypothetical protein
MAAKRSNENLMWWTVGGLILFWLIMIPGLAIESNPLEGVPLRQKRFS